MLYLIYSIVKGEQYSILNTFRSDYYIRNVRIDYEEFLQGITIDLIVSLGLNTQITIYMAKSIQKHWRSNDLQFIVHDPAYSSQLLQLDLRKSDYWGEVLRSEELSEPADVTFDWYIPA